MSARGGDEGLVERIQLLEDRIRQLEQGVGLSSLTFRRLRLTDRTGRGKIEIVAVPGALEFRDLVTGGLALTMSIPDGFSGGVASTGATIDSEIIFGVDGPLTAGTTSAPWSPPVGIGTTTVSSHLGTSGSTTSTITILKNGASFIVVTFGAGVGRVDLVVSTLTVAASDKLTATVTTAGTGADDLSVQLRYRAL
jgi:hypothetical protein